jgi:hypothetical protein
VITGATPSAAPRGEGVLAFGLRLGEPSSFVRVAPRARVSFGFAKSTAPLDRMTALFSLVHGSLDACPVRFGNERAEVAPCLRAELSVLGATIDGFSNGRSGETTYLALGGIAVTRVKISGPFFGEVALGAVAPLQRDRFYLEPSTTVQRVSAVSFVGAAGVGLSIW